MYIKNNRGLKMDRCGTPANMLFHDDVWSFKTTLYDSPGNFLIKYLL